jgi:putative nucleotide binding protein
MVKGTKEEYVIILDFLPNGYPFDPRPIHRKTAIAQSIGQSHFVLLELVPKKGISLQPSEIVYIGEGKRDKIHHILGKLQLDKLTQTARGELDVVIHELVKKNESRFVEFFNKSAPINTRRHQIELLPGIGKKHMWEILEQREIKPFDNFDDVKKRVKLMPDPEKTIIKRILMELNNEDKYRLFVDTPLA